jgi:hypothetical protein
VDNGFPPEIKPVSLKGRIAEVKRWYLPVVALTNQDKFRMGLFQCKGLFLFSDRDDLLSSPVKQITSQRKCTEHINYDSKATSMLCSFNHVKYVNSHIPDSNFRFGSS